MWLVQEGYTPKSIWRRVPIVYAFGEFARGRGAAVVADLPVHVEAFVADRVARHAERTRSDRSMAKEIRGPVEQMLSVVLAGFERSGRRHHPQPFAKVQAALDAFAEFSEAWEARYPAIVRLWEGAWAELVPFLAFDVEIRRVICTTNAIESINARLRRAVRARGHFPTEAAAVKCLYLAVMSLDPTGRGRKRWTNRWKKALNAFDMTFDGRVSAGRN